MHSNEYRPLAARWTERASKSRPSPAPHRRGALLRPQVVHAPSAAEPLVIVRSNFDGRIFALGENADGETVVVEVER